MRNEEDIKKAYALTAKKADELEEESPMNSAAAFVLMRGLGWVLEEDCGDGLYEELQKEFAELEEEND